MLDLGKRYPYEQKLENAQDGRRKQRQMRTPEYFEYERRAINDKLLKLGVSAVNMEEFYAGRLYTGPLFYKYDLSASQPIHHWARRDSHTRPFIEASC